MIKGVGAGGERRKRREEQKKGKGGGGREKRVGAKGQSCRSTFRPRAKARRAQRATHGSAGGAERLLLLFLKTWSHPQGIQAFIQI